MMLLCGCLIDGWHLVYLFIFIKLVYYLQNIFKDDDKYILLFLLNKFRIFINKFNKLYLYFVIKYYIFFFNNNKIEF